MSTLSCVKQNKEEEKRLELQRIREAEEKLRIAAETEERIKKRILEEIEEKRRIETENLIMEKTNILKKKNKKLFERVG